MRIPPNYKGISFKLFSSTGDIKHPERLSVCVMLHTALCTAQYDNAAKLITASYFSAV